MSATKIGTIQIHNDLCDILKSNKTGRFAVCQPNEMTPNFYETQEIAIEKAQTLALKSFELARKMLAFPNHND